MINKNTLRTRILLFLAIVITLNFLFNRFFVRLDLTGDKQYTLSQATKNILTELDEPVTVTAYFSENLPPQIEKVKRDFEDVLAEYDQRSRGNVVYEFLNPNESQETEQQAQQEGIAPQIVNVRESDQFTQQRVYLGAKLQYGDQKEVIPAISSRATMEYELSKAIKKISAKNRPKIGFIKGHNEANLASMTQVKTALEVLYQPSEVALSDSALNSYKTLVLVNPKDSFSQADFSRLDAYMQNGGGLLVAFNRVDMDFSTASGNEVTTGLEAWLDNKGILVDNQFVIDENCGQISVQDQSRSFFGMPMTQRIAFPYFPIIKTFNQEHIISKGIEEIIMPGASHITYNGKDKFTVLASTSSRSGYAEVPLQIDVQRQWTAADFPTRKLTVGGALEAANGEKMVVYSDGDFAINGTGQQQQRLGENNVNLFVNAVDWLSDDTGLAALRTKAVVSRPLEKDLDESQRSMVKWGNFLIPILLIMLYGFLRSQARKRKRNKWANEQYV